MSRITDLCLALVFCVGGFLMLAHVFQPSLSQIEALCLFGIAWLILLNRKVS